MGGECVVCRRSLKTGRKYCYQHKSARYDSYRRRRPLTEEERRLVRKIQFFLIAVIPLALATYYVVIHWVFFITIAIGLSLVFTYRFGKLGDNYLKKIDWLCLWIAIYLFIVILLARTHYL